MQFNKNKASSGGGILQIVSSLTGERLSGNEVIPDDDTIPQKTEGKELFTLDITPKIAGSILEIEVKIYASNSSGGLFQNTALFINDVSDCLCCELIRVAALNESIPANLKYYYTTLDTNTITFKVRYGISSTGFWWINGNNAGRHLGGKLLSGITIKELII